jgi:hypothetical protein
MTIVIWFLYVRLQISCFCADALVQGNLYTAHVDIYNTTNRSWTSDSRGLGQARSHLAAASLPSGLAFFAGGWRPGRIQCVCVFLLRGVRFVQLLQAHHLLHAMLCGQLLCSQRADLCMLIRLHQEASDHHMWTCSMNDFQLNLNLPSVPSALLARL